MKHPYFISPAEAQRRAQREKLEAETYQFLTREKRVFYCLGDGLYRAEVVPPVGVGLAPRVFDVMGTPR